MVAPGHAGSRNRVILQEAENRSWRGMPGEPNMHAAESDAAIRTPPERSYVQASRGDGAKTVGLVVGGLGVAVIAFGAVSFYQAGQYKDQSDQAARDGDERGKSDKYALAERWNTAGIVGVLGGLALGITGSVLWFSAGGDPTASGTATSPVGPRARAISLGGVW